MGHIFFIDFIQVVEPFYAWHSKKKKISALHTEPIIIYEKTLCTFKLF